jgi:hypothetical protein
MPSTYNLTAVPFEWPLIATTSLQALWALNEGQFAARSVDGSGNGRNLTTLTALEWADGISGKCLSFPGRTVIRAASGAAINAAAWTALSLSFWASKTAAATALEGLLSFTDEATAGIRVTLASGATALGVYFHRAAGLSELIDPNWPIDDTLRHYALTFDLPTQAWTSYRDGLVMASGTLVETPVMPNNKFVIGNADTAAAANGWVGLVDEVRVYNAVLTAAEIAYLIRNPGQIPRGPYELRSLSPVLANATLTVYDGRQPPTVDTDLTSDNNVMAEFPFPASPVGVYRTNQIDVLDPLPDTVWLRAGKPTFARVTTEAPEVQVFDCSVGQSADDPDLVIKHSPVRAGDLAHLENGSRELLDNGTGIEF